MNEKFFLMPEDKQTRMINAAYKVFSQNKYKKAPMSEIADEGNISKALLFHYFHNKLELYMYLWKKAIQLTKQAEQEYEVYGTDDFFEMLRRGLRAKCELMKKYPYLALFSMNAYYEEEPEIKAQIQKSFQAVSDQSVNDILKHIKKPNLRNDLEFTKIYKEILYASDGFLLQKYRLHNFDVDTFYREYMELIAFWEEAYKI